MDFTYMLERYFSHLAEYIRNYTFSEFWSDHLSYWIPAILANLTVTGSVVILAVLFLRLLYRKFRIERFLPYWPVYALWGLVLFRLLCPIAIPTPVSLFSLFDTPLSETGSLNYIPTALVHEEFPLVSLPLPDAVNQTLTDALPSGREQSVFDPLELPMVLLSYLWHLGAYGLMAVGLLTALVQGIRLHRHLREAVRTGTYRRIPVYLADRIATPFVFGFFRPKIYLPSDIPLTETETEYILLHEYRHIRRGDILWKTLGFLCICVHWFNPLVWIGFRAAEKDMELSCDQWVIRHLEKTRPDVPDVPLVYSETLLKMASPSKSRTLLPVAFGESGTGERIRRLVGYRKPLAWGIAAAVVMVVLSAALFATNPAGAPVTVLAGADYEVVQVVYAPAYEPIPADAPFFRITPDQHLMMIDTENIKEFGVLSPCNGTYEWNGEEYVTHEAVTLDMLLACRRWSDAYDRTGRIRPITDAWGLRGQDPGTWYLAFQTRGGKTYLAHGITDEDGSARLQWILQLKSTTTTPEKISSFVRFTAAIPEKAGLTNLQYYAEYSDARIPESMLIGFRSYQPGTAPDAPQKLGYAHFHVYDTGLVLDTVQLCDAPEGYAVGDGLFYDDGYQKVILTYQCDSLQEIIVTREDGTTEHYGMEHFRTGIILIPSRNENWADITHMEFVMTE